MNANDPILTAYALDELDPIERAQIAQLLRDHPQAADEIDDIRKVAGVLNSTLRLESSEGLSAKHREHVLRVAGVTQSRPLPINVVEGPSWWKSWQFAATAAACMVFGFGAYAIFDALTTPRPKYATQPAEREVLAIGVPSDDADRKHLRRTPETPETPGIPAEPRTSSGKVGMPIAAVQPPAKITIFPPEIRSQLQPPSTPPQIVATPEPADATDAASPVRAFASASRSGKEPMVGFTKPSIAIAKQPYFSTAFVPVDKRKIAALPLSFEPETLGVVTRALAKNGKVSFRENVDIHGLVNTFAFNYPRPFGPVGISVEMGAFPLDPSLQLVQIGITGRVSRDGEIVAENVAAEVEFNSTCVDSFAFVGSTSSNLSSSSRAVVLRSGQSITSLCLFVPSKSTLGQTGEILSVKLHYNVPGNTVPQQFQQRFARSGLAPSKDFQWAATVASFGWAFHKADAKPGTWSRISRIARESLAGVTDESRQTFASLIRTVKDGIVEQ